MMFISQSNSLYTFSAFDLQKMGLNKEGGVG